MILGEREAIHVCRVKLMIASDELILPVVEVLVSVGIPNEVVSIPVSLIYAVTFSYGGEECGE